MSRFRGNNGASRQQTQAPPQNNGSTEPREPPVWKKRIWTGSGHIEVAVWARMVGEGNQQREVLNTTIRKTYKEGEQYKESKSLRAEELPLAAALLNEAFQWIGDQEQKQ